jgi:hypothetical protein
MVDQLEASEIWLTREEAAAYLRRIGCPISGKTLANYAANGNAGHGPAYRRSGWRTVRYCQSDLDSWVQRAVVNVA